LSVFYTWNWQQKALSSPGVDLAIDVRKNNLIFHNYFFYKVRLYHVFFPPWPNYEFVSLDGLGWSGLKPSLDVCIAKERKIFEITKYFEAFNF
jgi:hypothetical protein